MRVGTQAHVSVKVGNIDGTLLNVRDAEGESSLSCFEGHDRDVVRTRERRLGSHQRQRQTFWSAGGCQVEGVSVGRVSRRSFPKLQISVSRPL